MPQPLEELERSLIDEYVRDSRADSREAVTAPPRLDDRA
jgi:hypothetical protein